VKEKEQTNSPDARKRRTGRHRSRVQQLPGYYSCAVDNETMTSCDWMEYKEWIEIQITMD
jgi:hypothetical protein